MSLLGYVNTGLNQSLNGIVSITDGLGTTIENGTVTCASISASTAIHAPNIDSNTQKLTDITYDSGSQYTTFGHNIQVNGLFNGQNAAYINPNYYVQSQLDTINHFITGIDYDTGNDTTVITNNLRVYGNNLIVDGTSTLTDVLVSGDVIFSGTILSSLGNDNLNIGGFFGSINAAIAQENCAFGNGANNNLTTASLNNSFGFNALQFNTTGDRNCAFGGGALQQVSTGAANTALGDLAGTNYPTTGDCNTFLGASTNLSGNYHNSTIIGYNALGTASNQIMLGTSSETVVCPNILSASIVAPNYTSSWFAVATTTAYTVTHNLGFTMTNPIQVRFYYSDVASPVLGTDNIIDVTTQSNHFTFRHVDSNSLQIRTVGSFVAEFYNGTSYFTRSTGYYKVYCY